jgi:hypothetical protein
MKEACEGSHGQSGHGIEIAVDVLCSSLGIHKARVTEIQDSIDGGSEDGNKVSIAVLDSADVAKEAIVRPLDVDSC